MWRMSHFAAVSFLVVLLGASAQAQSPATPVRAPATRPVDVAPNAPDSAIQAAVRIAPTPDAHTPAAPLNDPVQLKPLTRDDWTDDRGSAHRHAFDGPDNRHGLPPASLPFGWKVPF
jgi:hypothetical protein